MTPASAMMCLFLLKPVAALQHFDLVTIRIANEEIFRERLALVFGFDDLARRQADIDKALMFGIHIGNTDGEVAVAVAQRIRHFTTPIDGQFQFEIAFGIAEIDQREIFELGAFRNLEPESLFVKFHRTLFVQHPDHRVDQLGHGVSFFFLSSWPGYAPGIADQRDKDSVLRFQP
ncbi:hypothetical protein AGR5A_Cc60025 [Agrobacterium genomosp. 5 str. CFBP 6626]|nr:hypothetical protein AGR5A_Cc60025 [Agrobacterium genomosp. 5 str. CFBP 6626]